MKDIIYESTYLNNMDINNFQDILDPSSFDKFNSILKRSDLILITDGDNNVWEILRREDMTINDLYDINKVCSICNIISDKKVVFQMDDESWEEVNVSKISGFTQTMFIRSCISEISETI